MTTDNGVTTLPLTSCRGQLSLVRHRSGGRSSVSKFASPPPPLHLHFQTTITMPRHIRIIWTSTTLSTLPQNHFYCRPFSLRSQLIRSDHAPQTFITAFNGGCQASTDDHHLVPPVRRDQLDPLQTRSVYYRGCRSASGSLLNLLYFLMLAYLGEEQKTIPQIGTASTGKPEDNKIFGKPTQGFSSK